jgi:hypothetical protein
MADRIAADVATESSYVAGTDPDALEAELETRLIRAAARSFVQRVNSQVAWAGGCADSTLALLVARARPSPIVLTAIRCMTSPMAAIRP